MNARKLAAPYLASQSALVLLWWTVLWRYPAARAYFLPPGGAEVFLLAFWLPDLVLIVGGSLMASYWCFKESPKAGGALWVVSGALSYATLYCLALSLLTGSTWISVAMMLAAAFLSVCLALVFTNQPAALFRQARPASPTWNLAKTAGQITVFWSFFLFVLPTLLKRVEAELGVPQFRFAGQLATAAVLFGLCSLLGLWSGITMSLFGRGTPLPLDATRELVVRGPYAGVRNPMVMAGLGQGLAVGLYSGSVLVLLYVVVGGLIWDLVVRPMEEADLLRNFGARYQRYREAVKCWCPTFRPRRVGERTRAER